MDGMRMQYHLHGHGTLAANMVGIWKAPCNCTLVQADFVATTAAVGTAIIGTTADDDGYITAVTFGASNVPVSKGYGDFNGALVLPAGTFPKIAKGTVVWVTVTHNSMINPDIILTFLEG